MRQKKQLIVATIAIFTVVLVFFYFNRCDAICEVNDMREKTQNFSHIEAPLFKEQLFGAVIIDVRTPEEYVTEHISGAMLINLYADDFRARIGQLDRDVPYYVYCRSGSRSVDAVSIMKTAGFKQVYGLNGGINAWRSFGFELE